MGQDQAEQQRLLLAGRAARGRLLLDDVGDGEILPMGADEGSTGGGVAAARRFQCRREVDAVPPVEREGRAGEIVAWVGGHCFGQSGDGARASVAERRAMFRHADFERGEPLRVGAVGLRKQFVTSAHRGFVARCVGGMAGLERQHQSVEKAATSARAVGEQPVHRRSQPQHAEPFGEAVYGRGGAVDAHLAAIGCGGERAGAKGRYTPPACGRGLGVGMRFPPASRAGTGRPTSRSPSAGRRGGSSSAATDKPLLRRFAPCPRSAPGAARGRE